MFWFQTWKKWSKIKTKLSKFSKFVAFPTMFRFFSKKCSQISITFATMPCSSIAVARSISSVLGVEIPCISRLLPCATNGSVHYATIGSVHSGTPPPPLWRATTCRSERHIGAPAIVSTHSFSCFFTTIPILGSDLIPRMGQGIVIERTIP